jgi:hypothetical protein
MQLPGSRLPGGRLPDSTAASQSLGAYARDRLAESVFFADLIAGRAHPGHVRDVFGQYCLCSSHFHRWLGVCVVKSSPDGDEPGPPRALGPLIACLEREIGETSRGLAASFLAAIGAASPARIAALPVTSAYAESFLRCYISADRSGDEALAALAGRELVAPRRNAIITSALSAHYGVTSGLDLFSPPADPGTDHFPELWEALATGTQADPESLIEAARMEIWEHVTFWDDVYFAILATRRELAS